MADNPIFAVAAKAAAMRSRGIDVISLAAGEPQAATATAVVDAAIAAIRDPATHHYGPAQGDGELRELIATRLADETRLSWLADHVQITLGAKHALFLAVHALINPGDQVVVATPGWPGHAEAVTAAGGTTVHARTDHEFRLTPSVLERCRTARTRAVIISSPGNLTGAVYPGPISSRSPPGRISTTSGSSMTTSTARWTAPARTALSCVSPRIAATEPSSSTGSPRNTR
jgi:aspartate aminotransferase